MFYQYLHDLSKLDIYGNEIYIYPSQYHQIINFFIHILLVFVYLLQTYPYIYFFRILFLCLSLLTNDVCNDFALVLEFFFCYFHIFFIFLYHSLNNNYCIHIFLIFLCLFHSKCFYCSFL